MSSALPDVSTLHAILEHAPGFIVFTDLDLNILYLNRVDHGYRMEDVIGTDYRAFLTPQQSAKVEAAFTRAKETGETQHVESFLDPPSGTRQWFSTLISVLADDDGQPRGFINITTEVTANKNTELNLETMRKELLEASHRSGMAEVITGVLHNVGNVLNSAGVSAATLGRRLGSSRMTVLSRVAKLLDDHADDLGQFVTHDPRGRKLPALLSQLGQELQAEHDKIVADVARLAENLDLMRATIDAQQTLAKSGERAEPVDPCMLVERTLSMFSIKIEHRSIEVEVKCDVKGKLVLDRQSALQILANLVLNAIESLEAVTGRPRRLCVRVLEHGDQVVFEVEDNGTGFPEELRPKLFEHGFTTKTNGHGFGLHSSAIAANSMNGSLVARSDGAGQGASFRLSLPRTVP